MHGNNEVSGCVSTDTESKSAHARMQLERRGFYPKGGGRMTLRVASLPAGAKLPAFDLTTPGELQSISISAFRSGKVPGDVAKRMAGAAEATLRQAGAPLPEQDSSQVAGLRSSPASEGHGRRFVSTAAACRPWELRFSSAWS